MPEPDRSPAEASGSAQPVEARRVPRFGDPELLHLRVQRAPPDAERARRRRAVAAAALERLDDAPRPRRGPPTRAAAGDPSPPRGPTPRPGAGTPAARADRRRAVASGRPGHRTVRGTPLKRSATPTLLHGTCQPRGRASARAGPAGGRGPGLVPRAWAWLARRSGRTVHTSTARSARTGRPRCAGLGTSVAMVQSAPPSGVPCEAPSEGGVS